jgi:SAM-dependent MidA family methyltransferase
MQPGTPRNFPALDDDSAAHSRRCGEFIEQNIHGAGGSIGFAEFMQHALYAPGLGYYTAGARKFGSAGDFVTAPEVSALYGAVLARQCAEVLRRFDSGTVLEIGAGSGRLAIDVLQKLAELDALPQRYLVLEVSPDLCERQRRLIEDELPELAPRVEWIEEMPSGLRGVIFANEVLDALPVERFVRRDDILQQRVSSGENGFAWLEAPAPDRLRSAVERIEQDLGTRLADGYLSELSLALPAWTIEVAEALHDGIVFLFDYGVSRREYYAPGRIDGWLRCHFRHHVHDDPLLLPGVQDITAWVDFSAVAAAGAASGARVAGYVTQSQFLMAGGLELELADMATLAPIKQLELSRQVKMLTLPGQMGEHFKCLALARGNTPTPSALLSADRTHAL